jgi:hypothetical protein
VYLAAFDDWLAPHDRVREQHANRGQGNIERA